MAHERSGVLPTGVPSYYLRDRFAFNSWFSQAFARAQNLAEFFELIDKVKLTPEQVHMEAVENREYRDSTRNQAMRSWPKSDFKRNTVDVQAVLEGRAA